MDINFLHELERARGTLREAKRKEGAVPHAYGQILYEGAIVLVSARLQAHIDDLFGEFIKVKFLHIKTDIEVEKFMKYVGSWGNPNYQNINSLFLRIGIFDLLEDYQCHNKNPQETRKELEKLNLIRNKIAHGRGLSGVQDFSFTQQKVWAIAGFAASFGEGLRVHISSKIK